MQEKNLKYKIIADLLKGKPKAFDPTIPLDQQSEFLPYEKRWEFPKNRLRLGNYRRKKGNCDAIKY